MQRDARLHPEDVWKWLTGSSVDSLGGGWGGLVSSLVVRTRVKKPFLFLWQAVCQDAVASMPGLESNLCSTFYKKQKPTAGTPG